MLPLMLSSPFPTPTADAVFDDMIVGPCQFAHTILEAREIGCLPPRPFDLHHMLHGGD